MTEPKPVRLPLWQGLTIAVVMSIILWALIGGGLWLALTATFPAPR